MSNQFLIRRRPHVPLATVDAHSEGAPSTVLEWFGDVSLLDWPTEARRNALIALNPWELATQRLIRSANPRCAVICYKDMSSARNLAAYYDAATGRDLPPLPTGVGYGYADRYHPEWFALKLDGVSRIEWFFRGHWQMATGDVNYQARWLLQVLAELRQAEWDGVILDNATTLTSSYAVRGVTFPSSAALQAANRAFLANAAARIKAAGFVVLANISEGRLNPGVFADWSQFLTGGNEEHYIHLFATPDQGLVYDFPNGFRDQAPEATPVAGANQMAVVQIPTTASDARSIEYATAAMLLYGAAKTFTQYGDGSVRPQESGYDLGAALEPAVELGQSSWKRRFAAGCVIFNGQNNTLVSGRTAVYDLGASLTKRDGSRASQVTLPPAYGAVLRGAGAAPQFAGYLGAVLADRPLRYYRMDQGSGFLGGDYVNVVPGSRDAPGRLNGNATQATPGPTTSPNSSLSTLFVLLSYVVCPAPAAALSAPYAVEFWAKARAFGGTLINTRTPEFGFDVQFQAGGLHADIGDGSRLWLSVSADYAFVPVVGTWYHVVYVVTPLAWTVYLNGAAVASRALRRLAGTGRLMGPLPDHKFYIGGNPFNAARSFVGAMAEVAVYDYALSALRIAAHYAAA